MSEILKPSEDLLIPMAREVIEHARSGTMKQAPEIMKLPAAHYTDSLRFNEELKKLIKLDGLLAISNSAAKEVEDYLNYDKSKIFNISSACNKEIFNIQVKTCPDS